MEGGDSERRRPEGADRKSATGGDSSSLLVGSYIINGALKRFRFVFYSRHYIDEAKATCWRSSLLNASSILGGFKSDSRLIV